MKLLQVIAVTTAAFGRVSATHPSTSPTASPCPQCLGDLEITATASGYMDGNSASVAISYEGSYSFAYDDTWMDRGFNVIAFSAVTLEVIEKETFDVFGSWPVLTASDNMLSFLQGLDDDVTVAIIGEDAVDYWDANTASHVGDDLKEYMASAFGATKFGDIDQGTFRASYGLIGKKGATSPVDEVMVLSGSGSAALEAEVRCPPRPADGCPPTPSPSAAPPPPSPTATPPSPTETPWEPFNKGCYINQCGCPGEYELSWCSDNNAKINSAWCNIQETNCGRCSGVWCNPPPSPAPTSEPTVSSPAPVPEPSVAPIIAPTYPVAWCHPYCLELGTDGPDSSSFIPVNAAIESEYNAAAAMCSPFVDFSLDTNSCNGDVCLGSMETHSSCSSLSAGFSYSYTPTADGFIATFSASVDGATSGCCSCNSCASGAVYTNEFAFSTLTHTSVDYEFRAVNGEDWYEAVVAILKVESDGSTTVYASKCYRGAAIADFQSGSIGVSDDGNYILAFYPASYDRTGGSALGASLFVDGFGLGGP